MPAALPAARSDDELLRRWALERDRAARDELVRRHLPLSRRLAARYAGRGEGREDLEQVAAIGLVKAIERFELGRGVTLSTFAVPTIVGELKRFLRDTTWSVRVPRDLQELALRADRAGRALERELSRAPTAAELARHLGETLEAVAEATDARRAHQALSLDAPARADDADAGDVLGLVGAHDPELATAEDRTLIEACLARLSPRDREILRLRFVEDLTQTEIGNRLEISQMHVSRLIRRALEAAAG